ncbi:FHA domain-containing protein [bacterium]|nr:FHA domain-containing protein [bacterium]
MTTFIRKLVYGFIGLLGGLAAWPVAEVLLQVQSSFPSFLVFTVSVGAVFGAIMGAFLGSSEGIMLSIKPRIVPGIVTGAAVGVVGGIVGFLIGQGVLLFISEIVFHSNRSLRSIGIPISRVVSWSFLGMFIGMVEGVRALSWAKIKVGLLGGIIGGVLGSILLEFLRTWYPDFIFARLAGLMVFGMLIGAFYGLFEKRMSQGILRLLNGKLKGKEYLLVQRKIKIGSSAKMDIQLSGYRDIAENHALLMRKRDEVTIKCSDVKSRVLVNEMKIDEHVLRFEDVVQIGSAKFLFYYK